MALRDKYGTFVAFYLTFEIPVLASRKREKAFSPLDMVPGFSSTSSP